MPPSLLSFISIPFFGHLSDRFGRKRVYMLGAVVTGAYTASPISGCSTRGNAGLVVLAIVLSLVPHDMMYGPQAALIAESFTPRLRYSGASLGYQLASMIAGGPAPLIATALFAHYGSGWAVAIYILVCAVISFAATLALKDYTRKDISQEFA